ncbi:hypothetical protein [Alloscardovia omnicolens]|uniref:hypothetical protein n=1 Tax=Alloscardovia omnicolens TaxID=419015 RepID=UPI003A60FCFD
MKSKFSLTHKILLTLSIILGTIAVFFFRNRTRAFISTDTLWIVFITPGICLTVSYYLILTLVEKIFTRWRKSDSNDVQNIESETQHIPSRNDELPTNSIEDISAQHYVDQTSPATNDPHKTHPITAKTTVQNYEPHSNKILPAIGQALLFVSNQLRKLKKPKIDVKRYDVDNSTMRAVIPAPFNQWAYPPGSFLLGWDAAGAVSCLDWPQNGQMPPHPNLYSMGVLTSAVQVKGHWLLSTWLPEFDVNGDERWLVWPIVDFNGLPYLLATDEQRALGFEPWDGTGNPPYYIEVAPMKLKAHIYGSGWDQCGKHIAALLMLILPSHSKI